MAKPIILLVDCDNQSALRAEIFLRSIEERVGRVACAFLVGNDHGRSVNAWRLQVQRCCPNALIDLVVVPHGKEAADTELIGEMFALKSLFSTSTAGVFVASRDANIGAAGRMLESAGFSVLYSDSGCNRKTGEVIHALPAKTPDSAGVTDSYNSSFWLMYLKNTCKIFTNGKRRYANLADVGNALTSTGVRKLDRTRIMESLNDVLVNKKEGRLYFTGGIKS